MDDNDETSSESGTEEISNSFRNKIDEFEEMSINEADSELDMAINEELIKKSQDEIKNRMTSLKTLISGLKEELRNEKELWRQEIEQVIATQNHYMTHALCYANRYFCSEWDDTVDIDVLNNQRRICSSSKSDEDMPVVKYHSDLRTRRLNITNYRRNLAIENYKQKLLEVESMCNMELNRVKNSVQSLQTLQQVAAEWDQASGDTANKPVQHKSIQSPEEYDDNSLKSSGDFTPTTGSPRNIEI
ncbi:hypothetical protein HHI36_013585 [Cryptolaemus montrouzieri]|uniref:Uncharacterized protein n=1 Tax=Cryptolaemus montrouzieri TaxID=559131 RepID=A0ABD2NIN8_9CUCU